MGVQKGLGFKGWNNLLLFCICKVVYEVRHVSNAHV
jgi:hypothetical protein